MQTKKFLFRKMFAFGYLVASLVGLFLVIVAASARAERAQVVIGENLSVLPDRDVMWSDVVELRGGTSSLAAGLQKALFRSAKQMGLAPRAEQGKSEIAISQPELRAGWQRLVLAAGEVRDERPIPIFPSALTIRLSKDFWYQDLNRRITQRLNSQGQYSQVQTDLDMSKISPEELRAPYWDLDRLKLGSQMISFESTGGKKWLSVNVRAFRKVWVSTRSLRQGETLGANQIEHREVEVTFRDDFVDDDSIAGLTLKRSLPAQTPLTAADLQKSRLVRYGQNVEVSMGDDDHSITVRAVAQRDGAAGDRIPVLISDTKKTVEVLIKSASEVILE